MKFSFLDRLLGAFGGKKKKRKKGSKGKGKVKTRRVPTSMEKTVPRAAEAPIAPPSPEPIVTPVADTLDSFIDTLGDPAPAPMEAVAPEPAIAPEPVAPPAPEPAAVATPAQDDVLTAALKSGDAEHLARTVEAMAQSARALQAAAQDKRQLFASYQSQLERASGSRDFMTLAFVGSSLIVDASFFRDELIAQSAQVVELASKVAGTPIKKAQGPVEEFAALCETFFAGITKKHKMLEMLDGKLIKAHQNKDFATLSDITGALSRDAMILASLMANASEVGASSQTGLTATTSSEKAAQIDQQVAQLHQAILDQKYAAIADISRIVSLNAGVLADPSTSKAAQILQLGQQLQQGMKASPENPANTMVCANLAKVSSVFNGPLMDKASQLEGQVNQLLAALNAFDQSKMFSLAVTIARSGAILTDATIQKASLLAGYVPRVESSLKRKDFQGAASALKSAMS